MVTGSRRRLGWAVVIVVAVVAVVVLAPVGAGPDGRDPTSRWQHLHTFDLTRNEGWEFTVGTRPNVDSARYDEQQTSFGPHGMTITPMDQVGTYVTSDAKARFAPLPNYFALDADVTLGGYLGPGMFPALWLRPISGEGELDVFEYMGGRQGTPLLWKSSVITTPYTDGVGNPVWKQVEKPLPLEDAEGTHHWRYEKTPGRITVSVDGKRLATITREEFDAQNGAGTWESNFEQPHQQWYPRLTYQVGPPSDGTSFNSAGFVPSGWTESTMTLTRLITYGLRGQARARRTAPLGRAPTRLWSPWSALRPGRLDRPVPLLVSTRQSGQTDRDAGVIKSRSPIAPTSESRVVGSCAPLRDQLPAASPRTRRAAARHPCRSTAFRPI